jgi:hypothetical protein
MRPHAAVAVAREMDNTAAAAAKHAQAGGEE